VRNLTHKHREIGPIATKMVFIRYPKHPKGLEMHEEHSNGDMTKIDSYNLDFLVVKFSSIGEI